MIEDRPWAGASTQPAFGLSLKEVHGEHRYLNDAGDFQVEVFYTVVNVSPYSVSMLLPDSISFFVPDPQALEAATTLDCQIVDIKADIYAIALRQRSFEALRTQKVDGRDRPVTQLRASSGKRGADAQ